MNKLILTILVVTIIALCVVNGAPRGAPRGGRKGGPSGGPRGGREGGARRGQEGPKGNVSDRIKDKLNRFKDADKYQWGRNFTTGGTINEKAMAFPHKDNSSNKLIGIFTKFEKEIDEGTEAPNVEESSSMYIFSSDGTPLKQLLMFRRACVVLDVTDTYDAVLDILSTRNESTDAVVENTVAPSLELTDTLTSAEKQALPRETKTICRGKDILASEVSAEAPVEGQEEINLSGVYGVYSLMVKARDQNKPKPNRGGRRGRGGSQGQGNPKPNRGGRGKSGRRG